MKQKRLFYIKLLLIILCGFFSRLTIFGLEFEGNTQKILKYEPETSTGLDAIYVLNTTGGVSIRYESSSSSIEWLKFSNMGGGYAEEIKDIIKEGNVYILNAVSGDMGYIIRDGNKTYNFWIVDYSKHIFSINSISLYEQDCNETILNFNGSAAPIYYYGINGQQKTLSRELSLIFSTQEWDENQTEFKKIQEERTYSSLNDYIAVSPPNYCFTDFTLYGDRFQKEWGIEKRYICTGVNAVAVAVETEAIQEKTENSESSNQINNETEGLGGSAPAYITFKSYVSEAVIHYEWEMSEDPEFENVSNRFYDKDLDYTFTEQGTYYLRFIGSNSDGTCEAYGDIYTVTIGSSELLIPNAFSPNDDGVNDIWKVSYRSLLSFKCNIFDKHGHQIFSFENPEEGWDGTYNGKKVKPGVYFYVIEATGSDGKKYKKSGDINILNYKYFGGTSTTE